MHTVANTVGIDFGDINTVLARPHGTTSEIVPNDLGRFTPTLVGYGEYRRSYGEMAKTNRIRDIKSTISYLKTLIGLQYDSEERKKLEKHLPYKLVPGDDNTTAVQFDLNGEIKVLQPEQMVAYLFSQVLKNESGQANAVIAVPHHWTSERRERLISACQICNINVTRLVNDSTAAAVNYMITKRSLVPKTSEKGANAVYINIGVSSANVSVCSIRYLDVNVLSSISNLNISGRIIDDIMFNILKEKSARYKVDPLSTVRTHFRFMEAVEKLKKHLSTNSTAMFEVTIGDIDIRFQVTRDEIYAALQPIADQIKDLIDSALGQANIKKDTVRIVELLGCTTRMPLVKDLVQGYFGRPPTQSMNVDETVALGAAFLANPINQVAVSDVLSAPITAECRGQSVVAFPAGARVPSSSVVKFRISGSGIVRLVSNNVLQATVEIFVGSNTEEEVELSLFLDPAQRLEVSSVDTKRRRLRFEATVCGRLPTAKVAAMAAEEKASKEADAADEAVDEAKNAFEVALFRAEDAVRNGLAIDRDGTVDRARLWLEMHEFDRLSVLEYRAAAAPLEAIAGAGREAKARAEAAEAAAPFLRRVADLKADATSQLGSRSGREVQQLFRDIDTLDGELRKAADGEAPLDVVRIDKRIRGLETTLKCVRLGIHSSR